MDSAPVLPPSPPLAAFAFVGLFSVLLASFPARNPDLWQHLAAGRELVRGTAVSPTWLYDMVAYAIYSLGGGVGLVAAKALVCGVIAVLLLRLARPDRGWEVALAATGLAVLAMSSRLLLQPATVSVLFLTLALWLVWREENRSVWPGWRLVALFAVWANVDGWVVLGLAAVAFVRLGQSLDARPRGTIGLWAGAVGILVVAACLSPSHVNGLRPPAELLDGMKALREGSGARVVNSPFQRTYLSEFRTSPAALAYYPLLALGLVSFLLNRAGWRWTWFLPWLGLAVVSGVQVRTVPFFAVAAGPVLAWNLQEVFARGQAPGPARPGVRRAAIGFTVLMAAAFLASAWTGWLQVPPFGPRQWAVERPVALEGGAEFLRRGHATATWASDARTLHVSPDTASAFAWFCPEDRGVRDDLLRPDEADDAVRARLRAMGVNRVVVHAGDPSDQSSAVLKRLLLDPSEWPVLHLTGGLVVFGWRDPAGRGGADPFRGWEVDFDRLAFRPGESEVAPPARPRQLETSRWWEAFWKSPSPPRPADRHEATVLLMKAEGLRRSAPFRHLVAWEVGQAGGLVAAAGGWFGPPGLTDAALRLSLFRPPIPDGAPLPAITQATFRMQERFSIDRGDTPVGVVYAAIRAARRAVAENPTDGNSYLVLGRAYLQLTSTTPERRWGVRMPELARLRTAQTSAALNRAVTLNPRLAEAHFELARLYPALGCLDLAADHFRAYRNEMARRGELREGDEAELRRLTEAVDGLTREFEQQSARVSVMDRAVMAVQRGLGGKARDLLLGSDVAAFGAQGTALELELLLVTGRPGDVLEWMTPEVSGSLGGFSFHWYRTQALAAVGAYGDADDELADLIALGGGLPEQPAVAGAVGGLVGKALLDARPGATTLPHVAWHVHGRAGFQPRIDEIWRTLARQADMTVIKGLLLLEAGSVYRAGGEFRAALKLSPHRVGQGQLEFGGRSVAWDCLGLTGAAK